MTEPSRLVAHSKFVYESWNPDTCSLDACLDAALPGGGTGAAADAAFVGQVVNGLVRYKRLLSMYMRAFYDTNSGRALREDATLYRCEGVGPHAWAAARAAARPPRTHVHAGVAVWVV